MKIKALAIRKGLVEIVLALLGFILSYVGIAYDIAFLLWIGGPLILASLYLYYRKLSKEAKKEGVTVIGPM